MARRPHPYFGLINRLEAGRLDASGEGRGRLPTMAPAEQPGVLWDAFREDREPA